jgi:hypothetical protein
MEKNKFKAIKTNEMLLFKKLMYKNTEKFIIQQKLCFLERKKKK